MRALHQSLEVFRRLTPSTLAVLCFAAFGAMLAAPNQAASQTTILSVTPATGTSGVSTNTSVVFTFSGPMETNATVALFYTSIATPPYAYSYTNTATWNATSNVLTCTPVPSFMPSSLIVWTVSGRAQNGTGLQGTKTGHFSTSAPGSIGTGTNAVTTFVIGRVSLYNQTSIAQPTLDPAEPYVFISSVGLSSNRAANRITLTLPNGAVSNLVQNPTKFEDWNYGLFSTNASVLDTNFPPGSYTFTVSATASNETVGVSFPASLAQPGGPHLNNIAALQAADPTKPLTLQWDAFAGGTSSDYIVATVATVWKSPNPGSANALSGTATSVTIPAGTLAPGQMYTASVGFAHVLLSTNQSEATYMYRAADTKFSLVTAATTATPPALTNFVWSGGTLGFDVMAGAGQTVTVVSTTDLAVLPANWPILQTFTNPGTSFHIIDPRSKTNGATFYRARTGN